VADYRVVTPSVFEVLRIPLKRGRVFDEHDTAKTPKVFVISESFARAYFAGRDPIGAHLDGDNDLVKGEIIGVVGDVKHRGLEAESAPAFYVSFKQSSTFPLMNFLVRTQADPAVLTVPVQRELQALDTRAVVFNARPFEYFLADSVAPRRFNLWLLIAFAALAVALAMAGIYGTMSYAVGQRTREIGIRMALGARGSNVLGLILRSCLALTLSGVVIGLGGAFVLTRLMRNLLFEVSPTDAVTFAAVPLVLIAVALLAGYLPAKRATKVDPMVALRHQ
jgi:predicted permease